MRLRSVWTLLGILLLASLARTQPSKSATTAARIRIDKDLVLVSVTVCDEFHRAMPGLAKEHFRLFADKVEQRLTNAWSDDGPLAIAVVFDTSSSMKDRLERSRLAVNAFLNEANPEDEFLLVEFSDRPTLSVPLTRDATEIQNCLTLTSPQGKTALLDAVSKNPG